MHRIFLPLYRYFHKHRTALYLLLAGSFLLFLAFGLRLRFEEDIVKLLPRSSTDSELAFSDIGLKDKVFIQITSADPANPLDPVTLGGYMDEYCEALLQRDSATHYITGILHNLDMGTMLGAMDYGFEHLPCFIDTSLYAAFEAALEPEAVEAAMQRNLELLEADETGETSQLVTMDPLGLRDILLNELMPGDGGSVGGYTIEDGHFFCPDKTVALAFLSPGFNSMDSHAGTQFYRLMHRERKVFEAAHPEARVLAHGTPLSSVSNASTIKGDLLMTVGLSLLVILVILLLSFHSWTFIWQQIVPILYGAAFALACMYWIKGFMSLMALGLGAIVLGVAISYCLHVLIHHYFVGDVEQMLREESTPVTLGCITTVGAFLGLLFTESDLLRDFGLFATFALIGNTFFALFFLPHFMTPEQVRFKRYKGFHAIDRINDIPWDRNRWILAGLGVVVLAGVLLSHRVKFDSDLRNLDYDNSLLTASQELYSAKNASGHMDLYFAAYDEDLDQALEYNTLLQQRLDSLAEAGYVKGYSPLSFLLFRSERDQQVRIDAWKRFWTPERKTQAWREIAAAARHSGLEAALFNPFEALVDADYEPGNLFEAEVFPEELVSNYLERQESGRYLVFTSVAFRPEDTDIVSDALVAGPNTLVLEPFYYCRDMVEIVHDDFNTTQWISSLLVLLVLLIAFRNIVTAFVAFLPMFLSWYVLQGLMALLGLEFNLINIVISTFIFGIGVDYSIFVMEGLLKEARTGEREMLASHKVAIVFSALVLAIVVLSLIFARHPAIHSIGIITLIGMAVTILLTYSLEPFLFRRFLKWGWYRRSIKALEQEGMPS
ncbi:MAG: MMPL family transporter [Bacteroidales bacterium]|nr:MMPL family transporter [Bacteroidales bacterium]MBR6865514.1 MMPL family transporter [Bacteroidales bacterium]